MPADELHEALSNRTIWMFSLIVGILLLFGAWDTETIFIALALAGGVIIYLVKYKGQNLEWGT